MKENQGKAHRRLRCLSRYLYLGETFSPNCCLIGNSRTAQECLLKLWRHVQSAAENARILTTIGPLALGALVADSFRLPGGSFLRLGCTRTTADTPFPECRVSPRAQLVHRAVVELGSLADFISLCGELFTSFLEDGRAFLAISDKALNNWDHSHKKDWRRMSRKM